MTPNRCPRSCPRDAASSWAGAPGDLTLKHHGSSVRTAGACSTLSAQFEQMADDVLATSAVKGRNLAIAIPGQLCGGIASPANKVAAILRPRSSDSRRWDRIEPWTDTSLIRLGHEANPGLAPATTAVDNQVCHQASDERSRNSVGDRPVVRCPAIAGSVEAYLMRLKRLLAHSLPRNEVGKEAMKLQRSRHQGQASVRDLTNQGLSRRQG